MQHVLYHNFLFLDTSAPIRILLLYNCLCCHQSVRLQLNNKFLLLHNLQYHKRLDLFELIEQLLGLEEFLLLFYMILNLMLKNKLYKIKEFKQKIIEGVKRR